MSRVTKKNYSGYFFYQKPALGGGFFSALALSISVLVSLVFIDFIHGNPNRTQGNAGLMMALSPLFFSVLAVIGIFAVFSLSQTIQAAMIKLIHPRFGRYSYIFIGLAVPLVSIVTWYSYDYLTPTNFNLGINEGADLVPYQHGLNFKRYLGALACQGFVTAFSVLYFDLGMRHRPRKPMLLILAYWQLSLEQYWGGAMRLHSFNS